MNGKKRKEKYINLRCETNRTKHVHIAVVSPLSTLTHVLLILIWLHPFVRLIILDFGF